MTNRERRILEIVEQIDYETLLEISDFLGKFYPVTNEEKTKKLLKLIDDFQELHSNVSGIPIK